jgi:hypothetical protein
MFFAYLCNGDEVIAARSAPTRSRAVLDLLVTLPARAHHHFVTDCSIKILESLYDLENAHDRQTRQNQPISILRPGEARGLRLSLWYERFDPKRAANDAAAPQTMEGFAKC